MAKIAHDDNIGINIDKEDLPKSNQDEVVYKPTTMDLSEAHLWKQKFYSLEPEKPKVSRDSLKLYLIAFTANILPFCSGFGFSWTSPVFPKLMGPENPLNAPVDASQASIIASIFSIGAAMGPLLFGYVADAKGRKKTLIVAAVLMAIAFVILAFATDVRLFYLARLIQGIAAGCNFCIMAMYMAEITENHNRGKFGCYCGVFISVGVLYPFLFGPYLSVKWLSLSCAVPLLVFIVLFTLICPETPLYLTKIGNQAEAEKALLKLRYRKTKEDVTKEYQEMKAVIEREQNEKGGISTFISNKAVRNAMLSLAVLFAFQQLTGINAVLGFMEDIFARAGGAIPPEYATVIVGVIQTLTMYVTSNLIERLGRKFLIIISFIGCIVCVLLLGLYFYLKQNDFYVVQYIWWLPIFSLIMYIISFNLGLGPATWIILTESFPSNAKSFASATISSIAFGSSFAVTLGFPIMTEYLGTPVSFWAFGLCSIAGLIFTIFFVPETKGMTLNEIQKYFGK